MTEPERTSTAEQITLDFVTAINSFQWKADYLKFCEVLELPPNDYAEEKYSQFQELISYLNQFDPETLSKIIEAGSRK